MSTAWIAPRHQCLLHLCLGPWLLLTLLPYIHCQQHVSIWVSQRHLKLRVPNLHLWFTPLLYPSNTFLFQRLLPHQLQLWVRILGISLDIHLSLIPMPNPLGPQSLSKSTSFSSSLLLPPCSKLPSFFHLDCGLASYLALLHGTSAPLQSKITSDHFAPAFPRAPQWLPTAFSIKTKVLNMAIEYLTVWTLFLSLYLISFCSFLPPSLQSNHRTLHSSSLCSQYTFQPLPPVLNVPLPGSHLCMVQIWDSIAPRNPCVVLHLVGSFGPCFRGLHTDWTRERWLRGILEGKEPGIKKQNPNHLSLLLQCG